MMDPDVERERLRQLDESMDLLDTQDAGKVVHDIVERYENLSNSWKSTVPLWKYPYWQLVQDVERQAAVYANIIEELKSGGNAEDVKHRYEETLGLVPKDTLSNPLAQRALNTALKKARHYSTVVVVFIRDYGQKLLTDELKIGEEQTATIQVQVGLKPTVALGIEYTNVGLDAPPPAL